MKWSAVARQRRLCRWRSSISSIDRNPKSAMMLRSSMDVILDEDRTVGNDERLRSVTSYDILPSRNM